MTRIFRTLAIVSNAGLLIAFGLGWRIGDPASLEPATRNAVTWHFLVALAAGLLVLLVHAIALTYFMGTGRWLEETSQAYRLGSAAREANTRLKYRVLPGMLGCMFLVVLTGAFGAMADPAARTQVSGAALIHLALGAATVLANLLVSAVEYSAISNNGALVDDLIAEVRRIRQERGLDGPGGTS